MGRRLQRDSRRCVRCGRFAGAAAPEPHEGGASRERAASLSVPRGERTRDRLLPGCDPAHARPERRRRAWHVDRRVVQGRDRPGSCVRAPRSEVLRQRCPARVRPVYRWRLERRGPRVAAAELGADARRRRQLKSHGGPRRRAQAAGDSAVVDARCPVHRGSEVAIG